MANTTPQTGRIEITYFNGMNSYVSSSINKLEDMKIIENGRFTEFGSVEKRKGTRRLGSSITATANYGLFFFENTTATNTGFYRISTVSATVYIYYLHTNGTWTALGTNPAAADHSTTIAKGNCYLVNGTDNNRRIAADGSTILESTNRASDLYPSPKARQINYYKDRLYLGDLTIGATRQKDMVMMSSYPLGIVALVDDDHAAGSTVIKVTDIDYIFSTDSLDVYRGGTKIQTLTVTAKSVADENTITVNATANAINSADELWVADTYTGNRVFRWAAASETGIGIKAYDTFNITSSQNDAINMFTNIGGVMIISTNNSFHVWNDNALVPLESNIGCVSKRGYTKLKGLLYFISYDGIYVTDGTSFPKLISTKVQKIIDGATKSGLEACAAGSQGKSVLFALGDVTLYHPDGSIDRTLSDVCIEYNTHYEVWFVHTGITATQFETYRGSTDPDRLEFASTETGYHVYELFYGLYDDSITTNKEICMRIDTDSIYLSKEFEKICSPIDVIIETERGSGIQCFVSLDKAPYYEIKGNAEKGCVILKVNNRDESDTSPPRCRSIAISIRDYTKKLCKIQRVAIRYLKGNDEENIKKYLYG